MIPIELVITVGSFIPLGLLLLSNTRAKKQVVQYLENKNLSYSDLKYHFLNRGPFNLDNDRRHSFYYSVSVQIENRSVKVWFKMGVNVLGTTGSDIKVKGLESLSIPKMQYKKK